MIQNIESCFISINQKIDELVATQPTPNINLDLFDEYIDKVIESSITFIHTGEYVNFLKERKIEDISDNLNKEIEATNNILSVIDNPSTQNLLTDIFKKSKDLLEEIVEKCIAYFLRNVSELSKFQYTIIHRNFTFLNTPEKRLYELFEYSNIFLLEYLLEESIGYYENLEVSEKRVNEYHQIKPFNKKNILRHKIAFLKYKWKKRQKYNRIFIKENVDINFSKKYIFANEEIDLSKKIKVGEEFYSKFEDWVNKIEHHYFNANNDVDEIYSSENIVPKDAILTNNFALFSTIKFYKDIEKDFIKLEDLKNNVKTSRLDKKNKLYFLNNLFSLLIKNGDKGEDTINKYFNEIKSYSDNSQSNNYFIYYKFLDYKLELINKKIEQKNITISQLETYINDCEFLNNECNKKFEWTYKSFNVLYHFDVDECCITLGDDKIYFPTFFLLPISITENKLLIANKSKLINDLKHKLIELKYNNYNETIEKQIKDNEKKSIEIISLFTAVISFIMGSLSGFKFIDNIYNAISFVLVFGICLSIFLILILKLIRKEDKTYNLFEFIPIFILLTILIVVCLELSTKNVVSKDNLQDELIKLNVIPSKNKPNPN